MKPQATAPPTPRWLMPARVVAVLAGYALAFFAGAMQAAWYAAHITAYLTAVGAGSMIAVLGIVQVALSPRVACAKCDQPDHIHQDPQEGRALITAIATGGTVAVPGFIGLAVMVFVR
ncbi:MAG TPA: hypothetical protein VM581_01440 [Magnetospirillaceae bacterium]|nr:hypothetical protein [Magnetospirillaceae bacterium]